MTLRKTATPSSSLPYHSSSTAPQPSVAGGPSVSLREEEDLLTRDAPKPGAYRAQPPGPKTIWDALQEDVAMMRRTSGCTDARPSKMQPQPFTLDASVAEFFAERQVADDKNRAGLHQERPFPEFPRIDEQHRYQDVWYFVKQLLEAHDFLNFDNSEALATEALLHAQLVWAAHWPSLTTGVQKKAAADYFDQLLAELGSGEVMPADNGCFKAQLRAALSAGHPQPQKLEQWCIQGAALSPQSVAAAGRACLLMQRPEGLVHLDRLPESCTPHLRATDIAWAHPQHAEVVLMGLPLAAWMLTTCHHHPAGLAQLGTMLATMEDFFALRSPNEDDVEARDQIFLQGLMVLTKMDKPQILEAWVATLAVGENYFQPQGALCFACTWFDEPKLFEQLMLLYNTALTPEKVVEQLQSPSQWRWLGGTVMDAIFSGHHVKTLAWCMQQGNVVHDLLRQSLRDIDTISSGQDNTAPVCLDRFVMLHALVRELSMDVAEWLTNHDYQVFHAVAASGNVDFMAHVLGAAVDADVELRSALTSGEHTMFAAAAARGNPEAFQFLEVQAQQVGLQMHEIFAAHGFHFLERATCATNLAMIEHLLKRARELQLAPLFRDPQDDFLGEGSSLFKLILNAASAGDLSTLQFWLEFKNLTDAELVKLLLLNRAQLYNVAACSDLRAYIETLGERVGLSAAAMLKAGHCEVLLSAIADGSTPEIRKLWALAQKTGAVASLFRRQSPTPNPTIVGVARSTDPDNLRLTLALIPIHVAGECWEEMVIIAGSSGRPQNLAILRDFFENHRNSLQSILQRSIEKALNCSTFSNHRRTSRLLEAWAQAEAVVCGNVADQSTIWNENQLD